MNHQSRFDAGYRMLGAGALGWPREHFESAAEKFRYHLEFLISIGTLGVTFFSNLFKMLSFVFKL